MFFKLKVLKCSRSCRDFKQNRKKKKITLTCKRGQEHKSMQYFLKKCVESVVRFPFANSRTPAGI